MMTQLESKLRLQMKEDLHHLCQPLTALQLCLESSHLHGDDLAIHPALEAAREETQRLFLAVRQMRRHLHQEECNNLSATEE